MFLDPVGPSNGLSCETWSLSCCHNPHRFLQPDVLRLYFPTLGSWVAWSVSLPSCSFQFIHIECGTTWSTSHGLTHLVWKLPPCCVSTLLRLLISVLPTSPDECFFFNSLVVGLLYSLIFWQFWLFLFLNWLLSFFWLCEEAQCVYLCLHLG